MTPIDINGLLTQMRSLRVQLDPAAPAAPAALPAGDAAQPSTSFGKVLAQAVDGVAGLQNHANEMSTAFERGERNADLPQVMLAVEKAQLSFQTMTQVRNKLVSAYTDIMNMPM